MNPEVSKGRAVVPLTPMPHRRALGVAMVTVAVAAGSVPVLIERSRHDPGQDVAIQQSATYRTAAAIGDTVARTGVQAGPASVPSNVAAARAAVGHVQGSARLGGEARPGPSARPSTAAGQSGVVAAGGASVASSEVPAPVTTAAAGMPAAEVTAPVASTATTPPAPTVTVTAPAVVPVPSDPTVAWILAAGAAVAMSAPTAAPTYPASTYPASTYPASTYPASTYPAPSLPAATPAGSAAALPGWRSGAAGDSASSGYFDTWRGKPVQIVGVWGDTSAAEQTQINALNAYAGFGGDIDVAVGGLAPGETWAQAAQGAYTGRWREALRSVAARRAGKAGTTYIRFAHEMNGNWYTWQVNSGNVNDFRTSWRLFRDVLAQEFPAARLVFSPNSGTQSDITVSAMWPGDDLVDAVGVDFYDGWPATTDQATWDAQLYRTEMGDQPYGPGAWLRFAAAHGKPLAFSEWGLRDGDRPAFIQGMHDFLAANAARPGDPNLAGKIIYDIYFDIANGGNQGFVITGGANPVAAQTYRGLVWGAA